MSDSPLWYLNKEILRAEIETMRGGVEDSERWRENDQLFTELLTTWFSVRSLESQVHELESETEALSQSLEHQKSRTLEAETAGHKRVDELLKEAQRKVNI